MGGMGGDAMIGLSTINCLNGGRSRLAPTVTALPSPPLPFTLRSRLSVHTSLLTGDGARHRDLRHGRLPRPRLHPGLGPRRRAPTRAPRARLSRRTHAPAVLPVPTPLLTPSGHLSVHTACAQA